MKQFVKIIAIIFFITFICSMILFNGSIDDFAPKHMTIISEVTNNGELPDYSQTPAFYAFGSIIQNVTNFSAENLLYFPIQFWSFYLVFLIFTYKISNHYIFASVIGFIEMISGSLGTTKIYLWPHGLGYILFYLCFYFMINLLESKKSSYSLLLIISGSALVFVSYNLYAMFVIFLLCLFVVFNSLRTHIKLSLVELYDNYINTMILNIFLILLIVQFGLSKFLYKTFIPTLNAVDSVGINGIDKFLNAYFSTGIGNEPIANMLVEFPNIIATISAIKYSALIFSIAIFIYFLFNNLIHRIKLNKIDLIVLSLVFMSIVYSLIRLYLGGIAISLFYLPGIICSSWIFRYCKKYRYWSVFVIILLLILTPIYSYIIFSNNLTNKDISKFDYFDAPSAWYFEHNNGHLAFSDELSKDLIISNMYEISKKNSSAGFHNYSQSFKILLVDDATSLIKLTNKSDLNNYYIINYNLNRMSLQNWIIIKSWCNYKIQIENNNLVNNIYDSGLICIYF